MAAGGGMGVGVLMAGRVEVGVGRIGVGTVVGGKGTAVSSGGRDVTTTVMTHWVGVGDATT